MNQKYIIVQVGTFADLENPPCFQIFKRVRDFNHEWFEPVKDEENDPTFMNKARERLENLVKKEQQS